MLVRNRPALQSHCPRWWGATIGACAVALPEHETTSIIEGVIDVIHQQAYLGPAPQS